MLPYVRISRIEHWFKNLLILPGAVLAVSLDVSGRSLAADLFTALKALLAAGLVSSGNYIVNEILDAPHDFHHPTKKHRPMASGSARSCWAWALSAACYGAAFAFAWRFLSPAFLAPLALFLLVGGMLYNVPPFRFKEVAVLDVATESANNPIRMLLGWYALTSVSFPGWSLLLAYWAFGAFIMTAKRLAELRHLGDSGTAIRYRRSFRHYSERRLLVLLILAALAGLSFLGAAICACRMPRLLPALPLGVGFIAWVIRLVYRDSVFPREPEKVWQEPLFTAYVVCSGLILFAWALPLFGP